MIYKTKYRLYIYFIITAILFACSTSKNSAQKANTSKTHGKEKYSEDLTAARKKYPDPKLNPKPLDIYKAPPVRTEFDNSTKVDRLVEERIEQNKEIKQVNGYRIVIFSGFDRNEAMDKRKEFAMIFTDIDSYLSYNQPYYKVKIGDYLSRLEAQQFFPKLKETFPNSIIVGDKINIK